MSTPLPPWICLPRFEGTPEEALYIATEWHKAAVDALERVRQDLESEDGKKVAEALLAIQRDTHEATRFSCLALEMLRRNRQLSPGQKAHAAEAVVCAVKELSNGESLRSCINVISQISAQAAWSVWLCHSCCAEYDFYEWRNSVPVIFVDNNALPFRFAP